MKEPVPLNATVDDGMFRWRVSAVMLIEGERYYLLVDRDNPNLCARMDGAHVEELYNKNKERSYE